MRRDRALIARTRRASEETTSSGPETSVEDELALRAQLSAPRSRLDVDLNAKSRQASSLARDEPLSGSVHVPDVVSKRDGRELDQRGPQSFFD
jgi:hypothetical protein